MQLRTRLLDRLDRLGASPRVAIVDAAGQTTFAEVVARVRQLAAELVQLGVHGRRVALLGAPDREWVEGFWAILLAGAAPVPLSALHPPLEREALLQQSGAVELLLADSVAREHAAQHAGALIFGRGRLHDAPRARTAHPPHRCAPEASDHERATALVLYTSGTTGRPKGVPLSHENVWAAIDTLIDAWGMSPRDRLVHCLPLHHLHGICVSLLTAFCAEACTHFLQSYTAAGLLGAAAQASVVMGVPTQHKRLVDYLDALQGVEAERCRERLSSLRLVTSGSAKLPEQIGERLRRWSGQYPLERYGMTEVGIVLSNPLAGARRPGSCGKPLPGCDIRIVDERGEEVRAGESGEIWIRGPSVFSGYDGDADATASAFSGAYFKSGDTARWTPDGFVQILGRTSVDIIKSGGYKLSAIELEELLRSHPWVQDVAVVGVPDEEWGERAVAILVATNEGQTAAGDEASSALELQRWMKLRLASYQVPKSFVWTDELPRNAMGKVQKKALLGTLSASAVAASKR